MNKLISALSAFCLVVTLVIFTQINAGNNNKVPTPISVPVETASAPENYVEVAEELYESIGLDKYGLSQEVLEYAIKGYEKLEAKNALDNPGIITIVDFSQSSQKKRLYVLDIENSKLLQNTYVAHGRNSGMEYANKFSNRLESHQSSLGFYVTTNTYFGAHGLSLRMQGIERGINDRANARAIVIHGANYIGDHRKGSFQGRSFGCPAVPQAQSKRLINTIKDGTCLFIYHPSEKYLNGSNLLNA